MSLILAAAAYLLFMPSAELPAVDLDAELAKLRHAADDRMKKIYAEYEGRHNAIKTDADRTEFERWRAATALGIEKAERAAADELMPLLRKSAVDSAAAPGLLHIACAGNDVTRVEAAGLIRRHHLKHPRVLSLAEGPWGLSAEEWVEPLIRDLLVDGVAPADHRPRLQFGLAKHLQDKANLSAKLAGLDERTVKFSTEQIARIGKLDATKLEAEALVLFDGLLVAGVKDEYMPGLSIAEASRSAAYEIRNLSVGKVAPEIVGKDLDGVPLKLSDFRGKVVVLTFWARKCGPCLEFARREHELAARYAGRPFTPVGVNVDPKREEAKQVADEHKFAGRSFWAGPKGNAETIPQVWNVTFWPTVYIIDHAGVIRLKNARGRELDRVLEILVKKAESEIGK